MDKADEIALTMEELRALTDFAVQSALDVLDIFERQAPSDTRPRTAIDTASRFARGARRGKALRDAAWDALKAASEAGNAAAAEAARSAMCAASAAYLHPLAHTAQVRHILGAPAHAARALELVAVDAAAASTDHLDKVCQRAPPIVMEILRRFPPAPSGGARVGELIRILEHRLRAE